MKQIDIQVVISRLESEVNQSIQMDSLDTAKWEQLQNERYRLLSLPKNETKQTY